MAPDHHNNNISCTSSRQIRNSIESDEELGMPSLETHSFPVSDYVVIHQCDPPCDECEFVKVSNKQALKLSLKEEKKKNEKYRERLNDILKKYGQSLRQIEYQKSRIELLTRQLTIESKPTDSCLNQFQVLSEEDYTIIEPSLENLEKDDDLVLFRQKPRLEIMAE